MGECANGTVKNGYAKTPCDVNNEGVPDHVPHIVDIKKALPRHCFQGNLKTSLYYVAKDFIIIIGLYMGLLAVESQPYLLVRYVYTAIYWFLQGTMMWAIFVLGHDCGHGSFSRYTLLNNTLGNILHAMVLVPYYPWKLSHKLHHKNTGCIDKDEVFYPVREKYYVDRKPPTYLPLFALGLSWFVYLVIGYSPRNCNHFNPWDKMFISHTLPCIISLCFFGGWVWVLSVYWSCFGFLALLVHYLVPVFVFASWLVVVTFLHHQDINVPWYSEKQWNFVKGNLSSVDRHYGWAHGLTHNIGTHQIHHLFIMIPHYHLEEATRAFRKEFPHLVRLCPEPIMPSFTKMFAIFVKQCIIPNDREVHVFKPNNE